MVKLDTYEDITPSGTELIQEYDYVSVDSLSYLHSVAIDVTEYWTEIVNRCARDDDSDERGFYTNLSASSWNLREARDRVVKALKNRAEKGYGYGYAEGIVSGWTGNSDTNFYQDFGYDSAPLVRDGYLVGYLLFVSAYNTNAMDTGLDYVFQVDDWESLYQAIDPEIEIYCEECGTFGNTRNGGYSFEMYDRDGEYLSNAGRELLEDGKAHCPNGHEAKLSARDSF